MVGTLQHGTDLTDKVGNMRRGSAPFMALRFLYCLVLEY